MIFTAEAELLEYTGSYASPAGEGSAPETRIEITQRGDTLFAKLAAQSAFPVSKDQADHFMDEIGTAGLTFPRGADGKVAALVLHQNGRDLRANAGLPLLAHHRSQRATAEVGGPVLWGMQAGGKVTAVVLHRNGCDIRAPRAAP